MKKTEKERIDDLQCKGYRIIQDPEGFCFGIDAVLLANYVSASAGSKVLDLCTGTGIIPILLAAKTEASYIEAWEIQEESADLASRSVLMNELQERIRIVKGDIKEAVGTVPAASFDVVTVNPPYIPGGEGLPNPSAPKNIARHEILCTLEDVIRAASHALRYGGAFYMVHKPHRLAEIFEVMTKYRIEPKGIRFVHPYADKPPTLVLIEGRKDGGRKLKVAPPLILYEKEGVYTEEYARMTGPQNETKPPGISEKDVIGEIAGTTPKEKSEQGRKEVMEHQIGTLYLCATPIGNLEDMTLRALRILKEVDLIAAEDTRNSIRLLNHFDIKTPMTSYHEYNKYDKAKELIGTLWSGKSIALITDAGTPGISDPGEVLVAMCREAGITVTPLPGACAAINALIVSGLSTDRFIFEGFLPRDNQPRKARLEALRNQTATMILYEAPHHLRGTLADLRDILGDDRELVIVKELTKKYERSTSYTLAEAIDYYSQEEPKGEYVLVVAGIDPEVIAKEEIEKWEQMSLPDHMEVYLSQGMDKKSAMKQVAKDRGLSKREIYKALLEE